MLTGEDLSGSPLVQDTSSYFQKCNRNSPEKRSFLDPVHQINMQVDKFHKRNRRRMDKHRGSLEEIKLPSLESPSPIKKRKGFGFTFVDTTQNSRKKPHPSVRGRILMSLKRGKTLISTELEKAGLSPIKVQTRGS